MSVNHISPGAIFTSAGNGFIGNGVGYPQNGIPNGVPPQYTTLPRSNSAMNGVPLIPSMGSSTPANSSPYTGVLPSANGNIVMIPIGENLSFNVKPGTPPSTTEVDETRKTKKKLEQTKEESETEEEEEDEEEEDDDGEEKEDEDEEEEEKKEPEKQESETKKPKSIMKPTKPVSMDSDTSPPPRKRPPPIITEPASKAPVNGKNRKRNMVEDPASTEGEADDKCLGCSRRTCAIFWFVSFVIAMLGFTTALAYFFIRDALDITRFECNTGLIKEKITTEAIGYIPAFPFAYASTINNAAAINGQPYGQWNILTPATTALLLDGNRAHLTRRRPNRDIQFVWHCGCTLQVELYDAGQAGGSTLPQHMYKVGNVLKLSDSYPVMKMKSTKWYSISLITKNCYLDMALITITPMGTDNPVITWST